MENFLSDSASAADDDDDYDDFKDNDGQEDQNKQDPYKGNYNKDSHNKQNISAHFKRLNGLLYAVHKKSGALRQRYSESQHTDPWLSQGAWWSAY